MILSDMLREGGLSEQFGGVSRLTAGGSGEDEREPWVQAFPPSHAPRRDTLAMDLRLSAQRVGVECLGRVSGLTAAVTLYGVIAAQTFAHPRWNGWVGRAFGSSECSQVLGQWISRRTEASWKLGFDCRLGEQRYLSMQHPEHGEGGQEAAGSKQYTVWV
jgi:hypothetical protein